jgi:hypothetical protein
MDRPLKIYKITYTLNDDLKRYFIDFEAADRKSAIELLMNVGFIQQARAAFRGIII